jgi:hypothetical protein
MPPTPWSLNTIHYQSTRELGLFLASPANYFTIIPVPHISLSRLGLSRLVSFGLVSSHLASPHLIWPRLVSFGLISSCLVSSRLILSCLISAHLVLSRLVSSRLIWSCLVLSSLVSSHLVLPHLIWFHFVSSRFVSPHFASSLSFLVSSCFVLCYLFRHLSHHDWSCLLGLLHLMWWLVSRIRLISHQYLASCPLSSTCYLSL